MSSLAPWYGHTAIITMFPSYSARMDFRRQNLKSSKVDPRALRVKVAARLIISFVGSSSITDQSIRIFNCL